MMILQQHPFLAGFTTFMASRAAVTAFVVVARGGGGRRVRLSSSSSSGIHLVANLRSTFWLGRGSTSTRTTTTWSTTTATTATIPGVCRPLSSASTSTSSHPDDSTLDRESVVADVTADIDHKYMEEAIQCATRGLGHTFPNPAVGCVVVRTTSDAANHVIVGRGFHPRAGFPHAEVFALLEAAGHVESGVDAAQAIVDFYNNNSDKSKQKNNNDNDEKQQLLVTKVQQLSDRYSSPGGPEALFADCLMNLTAATSSNSADPDTTTTAYVTLEPCCHYGRTPPCAVALQLAKVDRVVVGFRDPNPRVDGGGVQLLQTAGIPVQMLSGMEQDNNAIVPQRCAALVTNFVKRITPRNDTVAWQDAMIGKHRMALRAHANRLQSLGQLEIRSWNRPQGPGVTVDENMAEAIAALPLQPEWMEQLDDALWKSELILLRLSNAVAKRKGVKLLGNRIAEQLQAHVAQSKVCRTTKQNSVGCNYAD